MEHKFTVHKSKIEGKGVFCSRPIRKGELICKMLGKEITVKELIRLYKTGQMRSTNPLQVKETRYLNLKKPYIFINHSCHPNAAIIHYNDLIAIRDIKIGEEITYDYSATDWCNDDYWTDDFPEWSMPCHCAYAKCRKVIRSWPWLSKAWQKKYINKKLAQDYILKRHKKNRG